MFKALVILCCLSVTSLISSQKILIGIAGGTGSGKTTLAQNIYEAFQDQAVLISQDAYYVELSNLTISEKAKHNFDHPSSLDFDLLREHLIDLVGDRPIEQPIYSFHTHSREKETKWIEPAELIIVEGILLFAAPEVRDLFDVKIYVDTDDDIRVLRRIERDIKERSRDFESVKNQYIATVKPMHDAFVEPSKQYADIIIPRGGRNQVALSLILAKLKEDLASSQ